MSVAKNLNEIGPRLREERERVGLNQEQFAEAGGVSRRTVVAWEKGEQFPNAAFLAVVSGMGVDVLYVLTGQRMQPVESTLTLEEQALLDNYKHSDEASRAAARRVLDALAQRKAA